MYYPESESSTLEFKRDFPKNDQIIKTMIGFCNQNGGQLIIGVNDQGKVVGISDKKIEQILSSLDKAIYEATSPPIIPQVFVKRFSKKAVIIIQVSSGMNKPYFRKKEGMSKGTYIRLGQNTLRATREILEELQWQSRNIDFEIMPIYQASQDDLDEEKIRDFLKNRKNKGKTLLTDRVYESYNLVTKEQGRKYPTVAGIILFGFNPQKYLSEAMIICSHFQGTSGRKALATVDCEGTLIEQFDQAYTFLMQRLYRSFSIKGKQRKEVLEIPEVAIREALLNAIVHRNYHIKAPIKVAIFENRVEIFSPGQFPGPISVDNLQTGVAYLRNPGICKVLREVGYVEKLGTGFIEIFESYRLRKLSPPVVIEGENFIKCILPRKEMVGEEMQGDEYEEILSLIDQNGSTTISEVMQYLGVARATAARRLSELLKSKKIKRVGKTRSIRYVIC